MYRIIGADGKEYGPVGGDQIRQWLAEGRLDAQSLARPESGGNFVPLSAYPEFAGVGSPPPFSQPQPPSSDDGTLGGLIPKNTKALVAYYCGIFSFIPCLGIPLGIVAVIFGFLGLKYANEVPQAKGKAHAWVGIICGGFFALIYTLLFFIMFVGNALR